MRNLLLNGDFRTGTVDVKVGVGAGTVTTSTAAVGAWSLNVDEHDADTDTYIRIRTMKTADAVLAEEIGDLPQDVIGDSVLVFDAEAGPLGTGGMTPPRVGFAKVSQTVSSSPKALADKLVEFNIFVFAAVSGPVGIQISNDNIYSGGTISTNVLSEAVQLQAGWNRVRRVFLHPEVLDTDPVKGQYQSGSHTITLNVDQGLFANVNINNLIAISFTGAFFGLQSDAEFDRVEEILRNSLISSAVPNGGTVGQVLKKNSSANQDASFANILGSGTESTTTGAIAIDLTPGKEFDKVVLTGNPTFSTANRANGLFKSIRIDANGSNRTLAFNASWKWLGTDYSAGVTLVSGKIAVLSLTCYGTAETDIVAVYAAQP